jgi:MFS family permease
LDVRRVVTNPTFLLIAAAGSLTWGGAQAALVALTWGAFNATGSSLGPAVVLAATLCGYLIFGLPSGSLVDRRNRRHLLLGVEAARLAIYLALFLILLAQDLSLTIDIGAAFLIGSATSLRTVAQQTIVYTVAGPESGLTAIALSLLAGYLVGGVGALAGGIVLDRFGAGAVFAIASAPTLIGMALARAAKIEPFGSPVSKTSPTGIGAVHLLRQSPGIRLTWTVALLSELFAFSSSGLLPALSGESLKAGAAGLGVMTGTNGLGAAIGLVAIAMSGRVRRALPILMGVGIVYGGLLVGLSLSTSVAAILLLLAARGAAGAALDSYSQTALQANATDSQRGAATGVWVFALGFGPIGYLVTGSIAATYGPAAALFVDGSALIVSIAALIPVARKLSRHGSSRGSSDEARESLAIDEIGHES